MFLFLIIFPVLRYASAVCPQGSLQGLNQDDCYLYLPPASWLNALEDCSSRGGHLTSIPNAFVNAFLPTLPKHTCGTPYSNDIHSYWVGASAGLSSQNWTWCDGSEFSYIDWGKSDNIVEQHAIVLAAEFYHRDVWRSFQVTKPAGNVMLLICLSQRKNARW